MTIPPDQIDVVPTEEETPYRMSAEEFLRAVNADVFPAKLRIFLRNGRIYQKPFKTLVVAVTSACVLNAFHAVVPRGWSLWAGNPVLTNAFSVPLPDFCIIRGTVRDYLRRGSFPGPEDIALVVEVAETSLHADRKTAMADYAAAGIPVYWIVNLIDWQVEVYTRPETVEGVARYASREDFKGDGEVPVTIEDIEIARVPARRILPGAQRREG